MINETSLKKLDSGDFSNWRVRNCAMSYAHR